MRFIGREVELASLRRLLKKRTASLVVIRGRRRIGKSRLIQEFSKECSQSFIFVGLPPEPQVSEVMQRKEFITQMRQQRIPRLGEENWSDLFLDLANHCRKGRILVALDEISWMGSKDPAFLGKLKTAWDLHFKQNEQLILIISGSDSTWIEHNILSSTGFVGRISYRLHLGELPLSACRHFFTPHASPYEIFKLLAVTGGIPRYLEEIEPELTAEQNLLHLCFEPGGLLFNEFDQLFSTLFSHRTAIYRQLLDLLSGGSRTLRELATALNRQPGGDLTEYLDDLQQAGFVQRLRQWKLQDPRQGELYRYRIADNYSRFYLKFIAPMRLQGVMGEEARLPVGWLSIMGLQFESLVVNHGNELRKQLSIPEGELLCAGPYFQTQTKAREGCQIDYMVQTKFDTLYLCEIKFSKGELGGGVIEEVEEKIRRLVRPRGVSIRPVLVHVNGVTDELLSQDYFAHVVDFAELLGK